MAAPGTVNYKRLYRRVALALNALQASTYAELAPTLNDRRRPLESMIRDLIVAKDAAVRAAICASETSPHRVRYLDYSAELSDGDQIPDHYGPIGEVVIKKHPAASAFEAAIEVDDLKQILDWRENVNNVFGSIAHDAEDSPLSGYFTTVPKAIALPQATRRHGVRVRFTGYRLKMEIATFDISGPDAVPPTLGAPDGFEDVIFAGAVGDAPIEGDDYEQTGYYRDYFTQSIPLILGGAASVPPLQQK